MAAITSREAHSFDLVDLGAHIGQTSIAAALHAGWLKGAPGGGYERAGEAAQVTAGTTDVQAPAAADSLSAAQRDYLPAEHEAHLQSLEATVGPSTFAEVESFVPEVEP